MIIYLLAAAAAMPAAGQPAAPAAPAVAQAAAGDAGLDAERLRLATETVSALLPQGSYGRLMTEMMGSSMDAAMGGMFDMTASDLDIEPGEDGELPEGTLGEHIAKEDPHFEERMRIMTRVVGEEMGRIGATIEPAVREGLTRAVATRFDSAQLVEINRFLATESGKAFGSQMLMLWVDPEMMTAMMKTMPIMMKEMPAIMEKVEAATAHLPEPAADEGEEGEADAALDSVS